MTSEICPASLGEPSTLKTGILRERVRVFIPFEWTKSLPMKLPGPCPDVRPYMLALTILDSYPMFLEIDL